MIKLYTLIVSFSVLLCTQLDAFKWDSCSANSSFNNAIEQRDTFKLKEGDFLFQDSDCGPFCEAIEKVTVGIDQAKFSHIGLVVKNQEGDLVVLEAISKGVILTPIEAFINRSFDAKNNPKVVVGRLKPEHTHLIEAAIHAAFSRIEKPYDEVFDINNDKYYCSELIYFAFKDANSGQPVFQLQPMTFNDPDTQQPFPIWVDYYKKLGAAIPENEPGLNPGGISRSEYLEIVHYYGKPDLKKSKAN